MIKNNTGPDYVTLMESCITLVNITLHFSNISYNFTLRYYSIHNIFDLCWAEKLSEMYAIQNRQPNI